MARRLPWRPKHTLLYSRHDANSRTGIDLIEVARVERAINRPLTGARFRARVFTEGEIVSLRVARTSHATKVSAGRFAAKEATMKALRNGLEPQRGMGAKSMSCASA